MFDLSKLRLILREQERFTAALISEGIDTGVSVEYTQPDRMLIRNLQGELPPNLFLEGGTARFSTTLATDPADWDELPHESGFLVYRILDPRFIADYAELVETKAVDDRVEQGNLRLSLSKLGGAGVPESIVKALIQQNENQDLVAVLLQVRDERVPIEMALCDFPPEPSQVTLRFVYPAAI